MDNSQKDLKMYLAEKETTVEEFSEEVVEIIINEMYTFDEIENVPEFGGNTENLIKYLTEHLIEKLNNV